MRGQDENQGFMFTYLWPEQRVRMSHPLRIIKAFVDRVLKEMSPTFTAMYSKHRSSTGAIVDRIVYGALRPDILRTVRLRYSIPLVSGYEP